jgi:ABC-type phosphate transport system substrate-binding protein
MRSLVAVGALAVTAATVMAAPAMAEPINSHGKQTRPAPFDIVGVGSQSITYLVDQLTFDYNLTVGKKHSPANPFIYSWDAVPPRDLNDTTQQIIIKQGCKRNLRPNGSGAGILALTGGYGNTSYRYKGRKHTVPCIDFARSSRPRKTTDPAAGRGGVAFVTLGGDAVTYASTSNSNVPNNLSKAQLALIFGCNVQPANGFKANTWGALLGASAKGASQSIDPILPQAGSGTLSFWATTALGLTSTNEPSCGSAFGLPVPNQPEENEGTSKVFLANGQPNPNVIYPFSVGAYVAEAFHSGKCGHKVPRGKNMFGCNQTGVLHLDGISGVVPTVKKHGIPVTNPAWNGTAFHRFLYDVVRWAPSVRTNHIPSYLFKFLGPKGYFCKQGKILQSYGFEPTPACGLSS